MMEIQFLHLIQKQKYSKKNIKIKSNKANIIKKKNILIFKNNVFFKDKKNNIIIKSDKIKI